jgi:hypothetical protein
MTPCPEPKRRRRAMPSQADLLRAIRAAQAAGWESVTIEHEGTIIKFQPSGSAEPVEPPNQRGLTVIP